MTALDADLGDLYGNTENGLHMGSIGGLWLAFIKGFLGLEVDGGRVSIKPRLPRRWKKIMLNIRVRGKKYRVIVEHGRKPVLEVLEE